MYNIEDFFYLKQPLKDTEDVKVYKAIEYTNKKVVVLKLVKQGGVFPISNYNISIKHKNIVKCLENNPNVIYKQNKYHLSVLEYVNALPLYKSISIIKNQYFNFIFEILSAISYLHDNGIIHGDIKADNILIKEENNKVIPIIFDYSTFFDIDIKKAVTPEYLAPEFEYGLTKQTDIWALGCLLFEIFVNKLPFGSRNEGLTYDQITLNIKRNPFEIPLKKCPEPYRKIIVKSLEKNPGNRYNSVDEMIFDLNKKNNFFNKIDTFFLYFQRVVKGELILK